MVDAVDEYVVEEGDELERVAVDDENVPFNSNLVTGAVVEDDDIIEDVVDVEEDVDVEVEVDESEAIVSHHKHDGDGDERHASSEARLGHQLGRGVMACMQR